MEKQKFASTNLIFLKLGGSLITDKEQPYTALPEVIHSLANEISQFLKESSGTQLIVGHGSGSFGHVTATKFQTRNGVNSSSEWQGFVDVWWDARKLNSILLETFIAAGLPVISFPVSAAALTTNHHIMEWSLAPLSQALAHNLIPVVYGDVVMDTAIGGTILSTEEIFFHLAPELKPDKIILLGIEKGVWSDFPEKTSIIKTITTETFRRIQKNIRGSASTDVTGGMLEKVKTMLSLVQSQSNLTIHIGSGTQKGRLYRLLNGEEIGTKISS
ncbi:MAG: isopentenyl phosphate kinase family protein [Anaerolineaceae bacterium]|nr:isopentenyl phosphate kinase family protein [Anaerolineaceae bacterium]